MTGSYIKKILGIITISIFAYLLVVLFLHISRPQLEIIVVGEHNPLENNVYVDELLLEPLGEGGKVYKASLDSGTKRISINGPFIRNNDESITLSRFGKGKVELEVEKQEMEDVARKLIDNRPAEIWGLKTFNAVIVFGVNETGKDNPEESNYPVMAFYNFNSRNWEQLDGIEITSTTKANIPEAGIEYFNELDGG